VYTILR